MMIALQRLLSHKLCNNGAVAAFNLLGRTRTRFPLHSASIRFPRPRGELSFSSSVPCEQILDMDVIKRIRSDIKFADANKDGKVDFEDLKRLFAARYSHLYDQHEIDEIGELLFVGKSGSAIKNNQIVRCILHGAHGGVPAQTGPNCLDSLEDCRNKKDTRDHLDPYYDVQASFDKYMVRYLDEIYRCAKTEASMREVLESLNEQAGCLSSSLSAIGT